MNLSVRPGSTPQLEHLHLLGCHIGQGYIVSPGRAADELDFGDLRPEAGPWRQRTTE